MEKNETMKLSKTETLIIETIKAENVYKILKGYSNRKLIYSAIEKLSNKGIVNVKEKSFQDGRIEGVYIFVTLLNN